MENEKVRDSKGRFFKGCKSLNKGRKASEESRTNHSKLMKRLYKEGILKPNKTAFKKGHPFGKRFKKGQIGWNKGLTKETDERVKKNTEKSSKTNKLLYKEGKIKIWNKGLKGQEYLSHFKKGHPKGMLGKVGWAKGLNKFNNPIVKKMYDKRMETCKKRGYINSMEMRKKISAKQLGIKLEDWKGFKPLKAYGLGFDKSLKNLIRKRDNQICMNCGVHREKLNKSLSIHHMNYDKRCNLKENLISLCLNCHMMTNYNRIYWQKLFQEKLSKIYNYKYDEKGNIIINFMKGGI